MPRAKALEFSKTFEIICSATGSTQTQAEYFHKFDVKYKKQWIRGHCVEETEPTVINQYDGTYTIHNTLKFVDLHYYNKDGQKK